MNQEEVSPTAEGMPGGGLSCEQALRQIERLVEECGLKEVERILLSAHLRTCPSCKAALDRMRRLEAGLKQAFSSIDVGSGFNRQVLAALPHSETDDAHVWPASWSGNEQIKESPRIPFNGGGRRRALSYFHSHRLAFSAIMLAVCAVSLAYLQHHFKGSSEADSPPILMDIGGGEGTVETPQGPAKLQSPYKLAAGEVITAHSAPLTFTLYCNAGHLGRVTLAAGSKFAAANRHSYSLPSGAAYFKVFKDRPRTSSEEFFEVEAGGLSTVRVTGTAFGLDLAFLSGDKVVVVEEGEVELRPRAGKVVLVPAGKETGLTGGEQARASDVNARLAWQVRSGDNSTVLSRGPAVVPPVPSTVAPPQAVRPAFDWLAEVNHLQLIGQTLADAVNMVAEAKDRPFALLALVAQAQEIAGTPRLSFSINGPLPLKSALAWMARDTGLRFDLDSGGVGHFYAAAPNEAWGPPTDGLIPDAILTAFKMPFARGGIPKDLPGKLQFLAARAKVTMIASRPCVENYAASEEEMRATSSQELLDALLARLNANAAYYDHVLFLAAPARIESLTMCVRRMKPPAAFSVESQWHHRWARDLKALLERETYPAAEVLPGVRTDSLLSGKPVFADLAWEAEDKTLRYRTGVAGQAILSALLARLVAPGAAVPGAAGILSERVELGPIADMEVLLKQAQQFMPVESRVKPPVFNRQAFVSKNLLLGEALEWAAWLGGRGLRDENNVLIVDDLNTCYGGVELQVLPLSALSARRPALAGALPEVLARLLPALYPSFFVNTELYCLRDAVVFRGDRRQLQLAQRLRGDLERALENSRADSVFDLAAWRPAWRMEIERNLTEPFQTLGEARLTGTFAWLLRQGALSSQLRCTVLVDPQALQECADKQAELEIAHRTVGQVLEQLAKSAGLKAQIEGQVIWLRP